MLFEVNIYVVNLIASKGTTICIHINLMIPKMVYCNFKLREFQNKDSGFSLLLQAQKCWNRIFLTIA
jgi:hypothetical protein